MIQVFPLRLIVYVCQLAADTALLRKLFQIRDRHTGSATDSLSLHASRERRAASREPKLPKETACEIRGAPDLFMYQTLTVESVFVSPLAYGYYS